MINGNSPDWIEIYNSSTTDIDISGYQLSDNEGIPDKYIFPDYVLEAGEFLLILADDLDTVDEYIHTNFKVSSNGEAIVLSNSLGIAIDKLIVPALDEDTSYGRINDQWEFLLPSPGQANTDENGVKLATPIIDLVSGIYTNDLDVQISHLDSSVYLNVFTNDLDQSITFTSAQQIVTLNTTTQLCAEAIKEGFNKSDMICRTYIKDTEHELPILSLAASNNDLFDDEVGLFELGPDAEPAWPFWGANFWKDEDTEVYFEFFNHPTKPYFFAHSDLEMHGGRESRTKEQKTFRLLAKQKYNQEFFEYAFFDEKPDVNRFKRIVLRNASGDNGGAHCRDGFLQNYLLTSGLNLDLSGYQAVAVYINGSYYGMMGLREKIDKYYPLSNYDVTEVDILEEERMLVTGDTSKFVEDYQFILNQDLRSQYLYNRARELFDINNLVDYFHAQIGNVSTAWPQNNIKYWRGYEDTDKWRYLLFDMDIALGRHPWTQAEENALVNKMTSFGTSNTFINTIYSFLDNASFHTLFMNRHQDLFNTKFHRDTMLTAFNEFINVISPEMQLHYARWPEYTYENWLNVEIESIREFIEERGFYASMHMNDFFDLQGLFNLNYETTLAEGGQSSLNTLLKIAPGFSGSYFKAVPITLTAKANPGYYFAYWDINNNRYYQPTITKTFSEDVDAIAVFTDEAPENFLSSVVHNDGRLEISLNNQVDASILVDIYNVSGQIISSFIESQPLSGTLTLSYAFNPSTSGIYFVHIRQDKDIYIHKIIHQ